MSETEKLLKDAQDRLGCGCGQSGLCQTCAGVSDRIDAHLAKRDVVEQTFCEWTDEGEDWLTGCGDSFHLNRGTPAENNMSFCYHCGKPLRAAQEGK